MNFSAKPSNKGLRYLVLTMIFGLLVVPASITAAAPTFDVTAQTASTEVLPAGLDGTKLTANLNGSGSTLVNPAFKVWQTEFGKVAPNVKLNYPGGGSGQGRSDFLTGKTDFGGSDVQVTAAEAQQNNKSLADIIQIPWTLAAVVMAYNLPGVTDLNLSPDVAGAIYTGKITKWNDAKIKADNPSATLPDTAIKFAVRADNSGTSQVFTSYLSAVSPDFKTAVGTAGQPKWEGAGINVTTAPGNDGVAGLVKQAAGTLGYVEVAYALQNNLSYASVKNAGGKFVKPSLDSISAAAASAKLSDSFAIDLINQPGDASYPIATTTYVLLNKAYADKAKGEALVGFLWYALHKGQEDAKASSYAPVPASIVKQIEDKIKTITAGGDVVIKASTTGAQATTAAATTAAATTAVATTAAATTAAATTAAATTAVATTAAATTAVATTAAVTTAPATTVAATTAVATTAPAVTVSGPPTTVAAGQGGGTPGGLPSSGNGGSQNSGDSNQTAIWLILALTALAGIAGTILIVRRRAIKE